MVNLIALLRQHPAVDLIAFYILFSTMVSTMPEPPDSSHIMYSWLYGFLRALSINVDKLFGAWASSKGLTVSKTSTTVTVEKTEQTNKEDKK